MRAGSRLGGSLRVGREMGSCSCRTLPYGLTFNWEEEKGSYSWKKIICFKVKNTKFVRFAIQNANALNENYEYFRISEQMYL